MYSTLYTYEMYGIYIPVSHLMELSLMLLEPSEAELIHSLISVPVLVESVIIASIIAALSE